MRFQRLGPEGAERPVVIDEHGLPTEPVVFMKASNTVVGPDDHVLIPRGSTKTDYEVELAEL